MKRNPLVLLAILIVGFAAPGCAFLTGATSADEAWAVRASLDAVQEGLRRQRELAVTQGESMAKFALARSNNTADLGLLLLLHEAAKDGTLTDDEIQSATSRANAERAKDAAVVLDSLAALRDLKVWTDTERAAAVVRAWTAAHLDAGEARRDLIEKALALTKKEE